MDAHTIKTARQGLLLRFPPGDDYRKKIFKWRWPNGFICPRCGSDGKPSEQRDGKIYQCLKCKYQASVTAGTVFNRTKTDLFIWFWMIFLIGKSGEGVFDKLSIMDIMKISYSRNYHGIYEMHKKIKFAIMKNKDILRLLE